MRTRRHPARILTLVVAIAAACATADPPAGTSGFLGDYSKLAPGRGNQARLVYFHPEADFSLYDAIIVDPVVVWDAERSAPSLQPTDESRAQADYFHHSLREHLKPAYQLVEAPRAGTLRLRMAIVEGGGSTLNVECEISDAQSSERLVAAVDERELSVDERELSVDERKLSTAAGVDSDVRPLYDSWAEIIRSRLIILRDFDASQKERDAASAR